MLQNIFGLDHLGDDTVAIKTALLKVRVAGAQEQYSSQDQHQPVLFLPRVFEATTIRFSLVVCSRIITSMFCSFYLLSAHIPLHLT